MRMTIAATCHTLHQKCPTAQRALRRNMAAVNKIGIHVFTSLKRRFENRLIHSVLRLQWSARKTKSHHLLEASISCKDKVIKNTSVDQSEQNPHQSKRMACAMLGSDDSADKIRKHLRRYFRQRVRNAGRKSLRYDVTAMSNERVRAVHSS